jgi:signal peptidase II
MGTTGAPTVSVRAYRAPRAWAVLLITIAIGLPADLLTKAWAFDNVAPEAVMLNRELLVSQPMIDPVPRHSALAAIPGVLQYRLVINRGAVFGIGANQRLFFIFFTLAALAGALFMFGRMTMARSWSGHVAVGLVIAGGLGNLYDRIQLGAVRDFIHMLPGRELPFGWTWPGGNPELFPWVFNVADMLLLTGMLMFLVNLNRTRAAEADEDDAAVVAASEA